MTVCLAQSLAHGRLIPSLNRHLKVLPTSRVGALHARAQRLRRAEHRGYHHYTPTFPLRWQIWEGPRSPGLQRGWDVNHGLLLLGPRSRWGPKQPGGQCACSLSPTQPGVTATANSLLWGPGSLSACSSTSVPAITFDHLALSLPGPLGPPSCLSLSHIVVKKKKSNLKCLLQSGSSQSA